MKKIAGIAFALLGAAVLCGCQDDVSSIGSTLAKSEVTIVIDSIETNIPARSVYAESFDSRSTTRLLGRLNVPEYGNLNCSFITQMMSATKLAIPDTIPETAIDSMRLVLTVPRGQLTGDSLAPQQLSVYRLTQDLPSTVPPSNLDPTPYYSSSSLLGRKSYTISNLSLPDTVYSTDSYVRIRVKMPQSLVTETVSKYKNDPDIFLWPYTFNKYFKGIYIDQNFGNGCVSNISKAEMFLYWNYISREYEKTGVDEDGEDVYGYVDHVKRDSVCVYSSQPEVLCSNVIQYSPAKTLEARAQAGDVLLTTPGGYYADIDFPVKDMIAKFNDNSLKGMSVVSALSLQIPANAIKNDYGITVAPYLLMVRRSEREDFFKNNKVPDGITSFYATYDSDNGCYRFSAMREYFLKVLEDYRNGETIDDEDTMFSLVPVYVTLETVSNYSSSSVYVTRCVPYLAKPTMTQLHTDRSIITFTFSSQTVE